MIELIEMDEKVMRREARLNEFGRLKIEYREREAQVCTGRSGKLILARRTTSFLYFPIAR